MRVEAAKIITALKPLMPPPPPGAPGPFALSDENALRSFAEQANLGPIDIFDIDCPFEYADIETAVRGMSSAGVAVKVMEMAGEKALRRPIEMPSRSFRNLTEVSVLAPHSAA